ncbi:hypothetical protein [Dyadobacter psychrotolerans]|uniref:Uncharacterized protein n=1 Tax=Dyadobacter psychrotolerans TaxID=2541721 RepID=A0A4R5DTE0_9BACT|nr:hypothetical protein [Dyadobacter psychrotolerans]TDE17732.1 hypothetical protein E0F88_07525 [Dyadobacter psychrotolerans]
MKTEEIERLEKQIIIAKDNIWKSEQAITAAEELAVFAKHNVNIKGKNNISIERGLIQRFKVELMQHKEDLQVLENQLAELEK